jgi:hypothetical protein
MPLPGRLLPPAALAAALVAAAAPAFPPALAPQKDVAAIAAEMDLPPAHPDEPAFRPAAQPYLAAALKGYAADVPVDAVRAAPEKYPIRTAVLDAYQTIRDSWTAPPVPKIVPPKGKKKDVGPVPKFERTLFVTAAPAPLTETFKTRVKAAQTFPAVAVARMDRAAEELAKVAAEARLAREPKRWQAHFTYVLAQCLNRQAFLTEYNLMLGAVLRDDLPDRDPAKHDGWRMVPAESMRSNKEVKRLAEEARELFAKVIADHPGTPWAAAARRELDTPPGLRWEPASAK